MRVLHYISSTGMGRGEVYVDLVNTLVKSMEVILLIPKNSHYLKRVDPSVEIMEYQSYDSRISPLLLAEIYRKIKKAQPDLVHTHFSKASQIFNQLNYFLKIPHVATKHNPRKGSIFNRLPHVIAVSKRVKESIENEHVEIIYNGIQPEKINPSHENVLFTLLAIGRLDKVKGFDILLRECAKLDFDFQLQIIGEGEERVDLERSIKNLGLQEKVQLLGFRHDIPQSISQSDLVIISSLSEGFGMIIVESLFYAKTLISTRVGAAEEILSQKFLIDDFQIAKKINEVYQNRESFKEEFDDLAVKTREKFLLESVASEHKIYYQKVLDR